MKTTTKTLLAVIAGIGFSTSMLATVAMQNQFTAAYPEAKAKLGKCGTCHVKPMPKKDDFAVNPFGKDMLEKATADKKTFDFKKIEAADSDGDGKTNAEEIKAGTNPGDPKVK
jgi:hypothetical protein